MSEAERKCKERGGYLIFRKYRKDKKTGKPIPASRYGLRAWPICIVKPITDKAEA